MTLRGLLFTMVLLLAAQVKGQYFYSLLGQHASGGGGPTYAIWDASNAGSAITLSGSPLLSYSASGTGEVRATIGVTSGNKRYWEVTLTTGGTNSVIGIDNGSGNLNNYTGSDADAWGLYGNAIGVLNAGGFVGSGTWVTYTAGDIIGIALDLGAWTVTFYKNGVLDGSSISIISGTSYYPACGAGGSGEAGTANFGQTAFVYSVPAGFTGGVY